MGPHLVKKAAAFLWLLVFPFLVHAQRSISGKVVSGKDNQPLAGISVFIKASSIGTSTSADGSFVINAKEGNVLVISGVGYEMKEITITGDDNVTISLNESSTGLSEVVVTALGVKKEVKKIGYAVQEVKGEDLVKARDQNPITGLTGKVAGLSVGPSPEMLRKPTVLLRGNEITLYVVDGIPISTDTWNISPDDIESYTILKGPAAAALYGSRAQYGAILITTKKGNKARRGFTVEFNSTNSIDKGFLAFPRLQDEYGPGANATYAFGNGKGGGKNDNDYDVWGPRFEGQLIPQYDGVYDPTQTYTTTFPGGNSQNYTGNIKPTPWVARGKNNLDRFLRTGFQSTNNIALNATGENYNMRFSLSHSYQQSFIPNMDLNITNFNMYGSFNPSPKLKIEANLNYNRQYTPNFPDVDYGPNSLIYNVGIWTGADWDVNAPDIKAIWKPGKVGTQSVFAEYQRYHNPWFMVYEWLRAHYKNDLYGYVSANYKINSNINVTARTQASTYNLLRTEQMPFSAHPYGREGALGDYREDHRNLFENNTEVQLAYNYNVCKFLNLAGFVGGNIRSFAYNSNFTSTDYMNVPGVYSFSNSLNPVQASSFASDMRVFSAYYSLDASLDRYATFSVTGRVDKSSALPKNRNSYFYPSVAVSSVLSDYIQLPAAITFLKVRGSFATVHGDATSSTVGMAPFSTISALGSKPSGNSLYDYPLGYGNNYQSPYGGPDYSLIAVYSTSKPYNNQTAAVYSNNMYDPGIKTFNRVNYEEGFDVRLLKNRLGISATAFQYIDGPRILQNPASSATGYNYYYLNALKTQKTGYEVTLTGTPLKKPGGLFWDVMVNWSKFQDIYKELPPGQTVYATYYRKGDRVDKLYTSAFVKATDGKIIHDAAGKPLANPVAQFLGYLNADYQWSIYNKIGYKGITLGFQFDGSVGGHTTDYLHNKTMRGGRNIETVQGALGVARKADHDRAGDASFTGIYVGDGVVVSNSVPINYDNDGNIINYKDLQFAPNKTTTHVQDYVSKYYGIDEANLMSKSYAKLREVTLTYDLPATLLKRSFINRASISLIGRNLIYFYKDKRFKDVDLDQYNYGLGATGLQSPTTRRYGVNLNIVF
ncbi:SusC/RagA family TonB-linked outer membrane protein [Niastella caeni]|uniref:SusC/RagA family TonB-linked outer membrane protein n=1 Tax=Niastella caeni TaxID=2569763 RepID=A0A4S8HUF7_9BACT|nr:SusC/RagA family TonB-linked outer membrane protein [Niastella caeni]THU39237.1 SusC/RagA family TonB-linked outer membrane protein [Niastella caeni]